MKSPIAFCLVLFAVSAGAWDDFDANVTDMNIGDGMSTRYGSVDGDRYQSMKMDLGDGMTSEYGSIGEQRFNCTTMDLGNGIVTTTCN